jgi:hypothetical protein
VKVLIAGWFSFDDMGATAGDLMVRDLVVRWLRDHGIAFDVATTPQFRPGVDWRAVPAHEYSHVVFACGPVGNGPPLVELLERFGHADLVGVDVTMLDPLEEWNPFGLLLERDSSRTSRPDFSFLVPPTPVPVVGIVLIHPQPEYRERDLHEAANAALEGLAARREVARLRVDTQLDTGTNVLRTPSEVTTMLGRADAVLTSRLHGLALSLAQGVPVVAIDPVAGGAKVSRQAAAVGWRHCYTPDTPQEVLEQALDECLSHNGRAEAAAAAERARVALADVEPQLLSYLRVERSAWPGSSSAPTTSGIRSAE